MSKDISEFLKEGEEIRDIDDRYCVTNFGRVFSRPFTLKRKDGRAWSRGWKEMAQTKNMKGYPTVRLYGVVKTVHRLLMNAFTCNRENKEMINHIDHVKHNNHISNLEWATASENQRAYVNYIGVTEVDCYKTNGEFVKTFSSVKEVCEELSVQNQNVYALMNRKDLRKSCKGFVFRRKGDSFN